MVCGLGSVDRANLMSHRLYNGLESSSSLSRLSRGRIVEIAIVYEKMPLRESFLKANSLFDAIDRARAFLNSTMP
jgi:hypothetical protein